jgi:hypothetical protein
VAIVLFGQISKAGKTAEADFVQDGCAATRLIGYKGAAVDLIPETGHLRHEITRGVDGMQETADYLRTKGVDIVRARRVTRGLFEGLRSVSPTATASSFAVFG